jgi:hypothetical protein
MRHLRQILAEASQKEETEKKVVFVETDSKSPFPQDTVSALEKAVRKNAKDLTLEWKSSVELVDKTFEELEVPKPLAYQKDRWEQYKQLLSYAIKSLYQSRGLSAGWTQTI